MPNAVCIAYVLVLLVACSQPLYSLLSLLSAVRQERKGPGPYRDSLEAQLRAAHERISKLEDEASQKDLIIKLLWYRNTNELIGRVWGPLAGGVTAVATVSLLMVSASAFVPAHAGPPVHGRLRPTMNLPMPVTSGGEIPLPFIASSPWGSDWQCQSHHPHPRLLAIGSTIVRLHCHLPMPVLAGPPLSDGDRAWLLWVYPERTGPDSIAYALN